MTNENVEEILTDKFGDCGCSETILLVNDLITLLENTAKPIEEQIKYRDLFSSVTLFYVLAGILSDLDFMEHGTAIRCSWLTSKGKEFLVDLKRFKATLH